MNRRQADKLARYVAALQIEEFVNRGGLYLSNEADEVRLCEALLRLADRLDRGSLSPEELGLERGES